MHEQTDRRTDGRPQQALCGDALVWWFLDIVPWEVFCVVTGQIMWWILVHHRKMENLSVICDVIYGHCAVRCLLCGDWTNYVVNISSPQKNETIYL